MHVQGGLKLTGVLIDYYGNVGTAGSILTSTGAGVSWTSKYDAAFSRQVYSFTSTQNQSVFTPISYEQSENVDVYLNGVYLPSTEYVLSGSNTVTLNDPLDAGESVIVITYKNW